MNKKMSNEILSTTDSFLRAFVFVNRPEQYVKNFYIGPRVVFC